MDDAPLKTLVFDGEGPFRAALWHEGALDSVLDPSKPELWLAPEERGAFAALGPNSKRRREWLAVRVAMKSLLVADGVARRAADVIVRKDARGCPRAIVWESDTGRYEGIACSLSHSAPFVLCAYARGRGAAVGVDVEPRTMRLSFLRRKFLSPGDRMLPKDDSAGDDTLLWSFKESLSKLLGTGWGCGFPNLQCRETSPGKCVLVDALGTVREGRYRWFGRWAVTATWQPPDPPSEPAEPPERPLWERLARASRLRRLRAARRRASEAAGFPAALPQSAVRSSPSGQDPVPSPPDAGDERADLA